MTWIAKRTSIYSFSEKGIEEKPFLVSLTLIPVFGFTLKYLKTSWQKQNENLCPCQYLVKWSSRTKGKSLVHLKPLKLPKNFLLASHPLILTRNKLNVHWRVHFLRLPESFLWSDKDILIYSQKSSYFGFLLVNAKT